MRVTATWAILYAGGTWAEHTETIEVPWIQADNVIDHLNTYGDFNC